MIKGCTANEASEGEGGDVKGRLPTNAINIIITITISNITTIITIIVIICQTGQQNTE